MSALDWLLLVLWAVLYLWGFWGLYVLVMGLYRAWLAKTLRPMAKVLAAPFVAIGFLVDLAANIFIATIVFAEAPTELLVTDRLARHMRRGRLMTELERQNDWRVRLADAVCRDLLDPFDPTGHHCLK